MNIKKFLSSIIVLGQKKFDNLSYDFAFLDLV